MTNNLSDQPKSITEINQIYKEVKASPDFPQIEQEVLKFWQDNDVFHDSVDKRPAQKDGSNNEFIFYDGPPFANGLPHYGHLLTGFIKDVYARYQTTLGKRVERRFGWDCHGLPAEMGAEKELGFSGRKAISEYGIDKFNEHCRTSVMKYTNEWEKYVTRQARWVDFKNSYKTMDKSFMESVIWAFSELYKKGLIYESMRVMPYSWACQTPLSNFETRLDNSYRERADKAVTVKFKLDLRDTSLAANALINHLRDQLESSNQAKDNLHGIKVPAPAGAASVAVDDNGLPCYMLAWTTTPWTLPSNLALAVGPDLEYSLLLRDNAYYIIGSFALQTYKKELGLDALTDEEIASLPKLKGNQLAGLRYQPLFDYFTERAKAFKVLEGDFVVAGDGTGIVHIAPGFGEDDQLLCQNAEIELVCPVDNGGNFTEEVTDFAGMHVFDANDKIIIKLKEQGNWLKTEQYLHNYPHCWRTDTPLIYKAVPSWYVKVTAFKDRMVELNQQINWIPGNVKDGLFGQWLENARDWSISRNRFWGTPIPVWRSDNPEYPRIDVYGSISDLERDFGVKVEDLHKPFIDQLVRVNPDDPTGKSMMRRVDDVFDCWFESGSMPYGQVHYPFENKQWFEQHFPADFIVEYSAQTRGWFYTLMVLSTALFDRPPFLNCICHGVILDASGQKLSKRLNNYADPLELFEKYGADALRVTMLSSTVVKGQELLIDKEGQMVFDSLRLFIKPIWSAYHFFSLYANTDQVRCQINYSSANVLDRYILSKLKITVDEIRSAMDAFDTQRAYQTIASFFEVLNNWYIRRSRNRFWKAERDQDKIAGYNTLYTSLVIMCRAMSSLLPLISEYIYRSLVQSENNQEDGAQTKGGDADKENENFISVHLASFPSLQELAVDKDLTRRMDNVLAICSAALCLRSGQNIRVRQPLKSLQIIMQEGTQGLQEFEELIKDEINVKSISYSDELTEHAELKLSINFSQLGKRLPSKMKEVIAASKQGKWQRENNNLHIAGEILYPDEFSLILVPKTKTTLKLNDLVKNDLAKNNVVKNDAIKNDLAKGLDAKVEAGNGGEEKVAAVLPGNIGIIYLDIALNDQLLAEGVARDLVRLIQQARKDADFAVTDRIKLALNSEMDLSAILEVHQQFICEQTLSQLIKLDFIPEFTVTAKLQDRNIEIALARA